MGLFTKSAKAAIMRNHNKNPDVLTDCALLRSRAHPYFWRTVWEVIFDNKALFFEYIV